MAGPFLSMVDSNIVNVAVPDIAHDLHAQLTTVQWTLSAYLLAMGGMLAANAYLAKRFGTRPVYVAGLAAFTLASVLCALSHSINFLIGARVLQGAAGAPLIPLAMGMLMGRSSGGGRQMSPAVGILLFMAPAAGPTIGGFLIASFGWPSIFLVNLPFGILGTLGALRIDERLAPPADPRARFDPLGLALLAAGVTLTLYGASQGPARGWWGSSVWPFWTWGVLLLFGYAVWGLRHRQPALDLGLLREFQPALALTLSVITSAVMFAALFLVPVFMQSVQRLSALTAGLALLPQGVVIGVAAVAGSQMAQRGWLRRSALAGMVLLTGTTAGLLILTLETPAWVTAVILAGRGFAMGLVVTPLLLATLGQVRREEAADANTLFNVAQRIAGSFGIALLATFLQSQEQSHVQAAVTTAGLPRAGLPSSAPDFSSLPPATQHQLGAAAVAGFHDTFVLLTAVSIIGIGLALLIRDRKPEVAMEREAVAQAAP